MCDMPYGIAAVNSLMAGIFKKMVKESEVH